MMTVIVTNDTPPAIRGLLKRWFIEPKPNVFVGTVNQRVKTKVLEYIRRNAPGLGILVVSTDQSAQGFTIDSFGETDRRPVRYCGIHLIAEDWDGRNEPDSDE
ncbi:MAG: type I-E CRISPR-associated endoribonuclease Cas2e [Planctomycetia bacterium]|nr:type I-E CRISPR-associated endoribonuclease Cas2e [Planctomycetia bacterium]